MAAPSTSVYTTTMAPTTYVSQPSIRVDPTYHVAPVATKPRSWSKYLAELIGTAVLVATIAYCSGPQTPGSTVAMRAVAIGCALAVMIFALGRVSGGHFNPAVSFAAAITGNIPFEELPFYWLAQFLGALIAGFGVGIDSVNMMGSPSKWTYPFLVSAFEESVYTYMLVFVVLHVSCIWSANRVKIGNQFSGIAIGFVLIAGILASATLSNSCFNPAVTLGLVFPYATQSKEIDDKMTADVGQAFIYVLFQLLAAAKAAIHFWLTRPDQYTGTVCGTRFFSPVVSWMGRRSVHDQNQTHSDCPSVKTRVFAEFLGVFMIAFTACNCQNRSDWHFAVACVVMCMTFALRDVSGAHFNPAVTLAVHLSGRDCCPGFDAAIYMLAQVKGGILGALFSVWLRWDTSTVLLVGAHGTREWYIVGFGELFFTAVLAFVVLSVATTENGPSEYSGFAIGMCYTIGGYALATFSGGFLNPALAIGSVAGSYGLGEWEQEHHWLWLGGYVVAGFLGAVVAAIVFMVTQPTEYEPGENVIADYFADFGDAKETLGAPLLSDA